MWPYHIFNKILGFHCYNFVLQSDCDNVNKNKSEVIIKGIQAEFQLDEINLFRKLSFTCPFIILGLSSEELKNNIWPSWGRWGAAAFPFSPSVPCFSSKKPRREREDQGLWENNKQSSNDEATCDEDHEETWRISYWVWWRRSCWAWWWKWWGVTGSCLWWTCGNQLLISAANASALPESHHILRFKSSAELTPVLRAVIFDNDLSTGANL